MSVIFVSIGALCCYLAATVSQSLRHRGRNVPKSRVLLITAIGLICHIASLSVTINIARGINLGVFTISSLTSMMVTVVVLLSSLKKPSESLLVMILPVCMLTIVLTITTPVEHTVWNHTSYMISHVLISIMAYGIIMIAAFQAILLAYQEHQLRTHRHTMKTLPPLQTMEQLLFDFLRLGLILLMLSLGSGFLFLEDIFAQQMLHKTVLSITAWCVFAVLLIGHWRYGWRGQTAVRWTLAGFLFLVFAYFGSRLVLDYMIPS